MSSRFRAWIITTGVSRADLKARAALADTAFERYVGELIELGVYAKEHGVSVPSSVQERKQPGKRTVSEKLP